MNPREIPKDIKILPEWRNFAKSGHTDRDQNYFFAKVRQ